MTTISGICAEKGEKKGVILTSDAARTGTQWIPRGDVAVKQQTRAEGQKLFVSNDRQFVVGMAGIYDQEYLSFVDALLKGKMDIEKILKKGDFPQLRELNLYRWGGRVPDGDRMNNLMMATRFGENPSLYTCWPMGLIEERLWTAIGSGAEYALGTIREGMLSPGGVSLEEGFDLAVAASDSAATDIYTGGLDIVVVSPEGISQYGKKIKGEVAKARERVLGKIKGEL
jgi:hypothetical protein